MENRIKKLESKFRKLDVDTENMQEFKILKNDLLKEEAVNALEKIEIKYQYLRDVVDKFYHLVNIYECYDVAIIDSNMLNGIKRSINSLKEQIVSEDFDIDRSIISRIIEEELLALDTRIKLLDHYTEEITDIGIKFESIDMDPVLMPEFGKTITNFINLKSYLRQVNVQTIDSYIQETIKSLNESLAYIKDLFRVCNFNYTNVWGLAEKLEKSGIDIYGIEEFQNIAVLIDLINKTLTETVEEEIQMENKEERSLHM